MGACLNVFGSTMSLFFKSEASQGLNDKTRSAISMFAEGIHLLSDHHYRLSLARRAFAKPSLNIISKNVADAAFIDEFLFGNNFVETLKAACEKTEREISQLTTQMEKKTL